MVIPETVGELRRYLDTYPDEMPLILSTIHDGQLHFFVTKELRHFPKTRRTEDTIVLQEISETDWLMSPMGRDDE